MKITIGFEESGYVVWTDTGIRYGEFETMGDAALYANGLSHGYNAARAKLGRAHGYKTEKSAIEQNAKLAA